MESRSHPGPATMAHHEATLATLRQGGFDVVATAHAYALLDSYVYGFALQEATLPFVPDGTDAAAVAAAARPILDEAGDDFPYFTELAVEHVLRPGYSFADEFTFGLDLLLDGLDRLRSA